LLALERGEVAGGGEAGLVTAGSGGSTISATSKAGVGELAGGCVSSGTVFSRLPASAGMMLYELSGMESEEHGFPARDQCNMLVYKLVNGRLRIIVH
jgi:cytidylate kinase